jgi:hypothetical protein
MGVRREYGTNGMNGTNGKEPFQDASVCSVISVCSVFSPLPLDKSSNYGRAQYNLKTEPARQAFRFYS